MLVFTHTHNTLSLTHTHNTLSLTHTAAVPETSCELGTAKYFAMCGFGGILSCGITHTALVSLDLVKTRIQASENVHICCERNNEVVILGWQYSCTQSE